MLFKSNVVIAIMLVSGISPQSMANSPEKCQPILDLLIGGKELSEEGFQTAKHYIEKNPEGILALRQVFNLKQDQLFELAKTAVKADPSAYAYFVRETPLLSDIEKGFLKKLAFKTAIVRENIPDSIYPDIENYVNRYEPLFESRFILSQAKSVDEAKNIIKTIPQLRGKEKLIDIAWDRTQRLGIGIRLIEEGVKRLGTGKEIPDNSLELLADISGLNYQYLLANKYSEEEVNAIYEIVLGVQKNLFGPFFKNIIISRNIYSDSGKFISLISMIGSLKFIMGDDGNAANKVIRVIKDRPITIKTYDFILRLLKKIFTDEFPHLEEGIQDLVQKWKISDPDYTLLPKMIILRR